MEVNSRLKLTSLNICFKNFKSLVEYSIFPVIYKHCPLANNNTLNIGITIDLFFNQAKTNLIE